jgi:hypothetical protein
MSAATLYGLAAWALLAGTGAALFFRARPLPTAFGVAALALAPLFAGESLAMLLHGALAAPSFTLVQLALWRLAAPSRPGPLGVHAAAALTAAALVFYPLALGLGPFDPYGLGYRPIVLLAAFLPLAGWLARGRHQAWLVILGFDLLAYAAGLFNNLWDALFDPVLVLLAAATLALRWRQSRGISRPLPGRSGA